MEIVEIERNAEPYSKGYRVGICCKRYEHVRLITVLYDFWLNQMYVDHMFDVHFTMDIDSNCVLCFKSMEDLFLAKMMYGWSELD